MGRKMEFLQVFDKPKKIRKEGKWNTVQVKQRENIKIYLILKY